MRAEQMELQQNAYQSSRTRSPTCIIDRFKAKASKAKQAQSRVKALDRMEKIAPAHVDSPFHFALLAAEKNPDPLLRLDGISAGYADTAIISQVKLSLSPGDRIVEDTSDRPMACNVASISPTSLSISAADTGRLAHEMRMPRSNFSRSNSSRVLSCLMMRGVARIGRSYVL